MSTRILFKNAVVSEDELAEAYHRAVTYRSRDKKHVAPWTPDRFDSLYIAFVENGRRVTGGFGKRRDNTNRRDGKYGHLSYGVVEIGWV
jgi:hypothetical protein